MGCVNPTKQTPRLQQKTSKYPQQQPTIQPDHHYESVVTHNEVSQKACGYEFGLGGSAAQAGSVGHTVKNQVPVYFQEVNKLVGMAGYYYQNHDIDSANDCVNGIDMLIDKYQGTSIANQLSEIVMQNIRLLNQIKQQYQDMITNQQQLKKPGWVQKSNRKGVRVCTRREESTVGVLVQSVIDEPFQYLITFCNQMDLYKDFMPFMKVSRQEKIVARNCRIGYTENHIPLLSVREAFFQGIGYDRLKKDNTLFLYTRSIHDRPDLQEKLGYKCHPNPQNVQLEYKYFILIYQPISRGKGKITLAMNVDTKLDFIPLWIQDMVSQDFGEQFFANIIKLSKKYKGSKWQRNTNANPQLFLFFKNAIDNRLMEMEQRHMGANVGKEFNNTSKSTYYQQNSYQKI